MKFEFLNNKKRLSWIDYAKGIAIILVVYRHILIGFVRAGVDVDEYLIKANEVVYSFRMPLFFILSGVFIQKALQKRSFKDAVLNKIDTLLYPYLIWATIQVTIQILLSNFTNADRTLIDYTYIFYKPRAIDHFWFLYTLFNVILFFIVLHKTLKLNHWSYLVISIILYFMSEYLRSISLLHDVFYYFLFFAVGNSISGFILDPEKNKFLSSQKLFWSLAPFFLISQWYWVNHPEIDIYSFACIAILGCFFTMNISFILAKSGRLKFLRIVGFHSLFIYIMHVFIASMMRILLFKIFKFDNLPVPLLLILGIFLAVIIPIIFYNLTMKYGLWFLYSYQKPKNKNSHKIGSVSKAIS